MFDDIGDQSLKNIARPIRVYRVRVADAATTTGSVKPAPPALALPDKPSIAVLPFQNMSGDPEQNTSSMAWSRKSLQRCHASAGYSSSPGIPASPTKGKQLM